MRREILNGKEAKSALKNLNIDVPEDIDTENIEVWFSINDTEEQIFVHIGTETHPNQEMNIEADYNEAVEVTG